MSTSADSKHFQFVGLEEQVVVGGIVNSFDLPTWLRGSDADDAGVENLFDSWPSSADGLLHSGYYPFD